MTDELAGLASRLITIDSSNPPGREANVAAYVAEWLTDAGLDVTLVERPDPERPSVAATTGTGEPTVVLNGHTDVVPVTDEPTWSVDPFAGAVDGSRLYGRGSVDMKTQLAVAMLVARDLSDDLADGGGTLVVQAAAGEETGYPGTQALVDAGFDGDIGIVLEPTGLRVATAAKGVSTIRFTIAGEPSHASRPDQGHNPIDDLRPVLEAISSWDASLRTREDVRCGRAYATVTEVAAGIDDNMAVIPGQASVLVDRRLLPEESRSTVEAEVDRLRSRLEAGGIDLEASIVSHYDPSAVDESAAVVEVVSRESASVADVSTTPIGLEAATDARVLAAAGMDAIIWGPGSLAQAHTVDEWIDLDEARTARTILERSLRRLFDLG